MTQEERQLVTKDILPRLQYGVKVHVVNDTFYDVVDPYDKTMTIGALHLINDFNIENGPDSVIIRPYLRPFSSMTLEERLEYSTFGFSIISHINSDRNSCPTYTVIETKDVYGICFIIDWLNAHHFDYRGLIEKGLAIEAPDDMYKNFDN